MICDQLPATLLLPALAGQPTKNERPHHVRRDTPNAILQPTPTATPSAEISRDARNRPNPHADERTSLDEQPARRKPWRASQFIVLAATDRAVKAAPPGGPAARP